MSHSDYKELRIGEIHIPLVKEEFGKKSKIVTKQIFQLDIINYSIKVEIYNSGIAEIHLLKNEGTQQDQLVTNVIHVYDPCLIQRFCINKNIGYLSFSEEDEDAIINEFNIYTKRTFNDINFFKAILSTATDRYKSPDTDDE
jgi:hypothetical protein